MLTVVEGPKTIQIATNAMIVEEGRDCAWAERNVTHNPAYKWILGKYVEADNANSNMQFWSLDGLRAAHASIRNSPLNLLHKPKYVVGSYVDTELVYPIDGANGKMEDEEEDDEDDVKEEEEDDEEEDNEVDYVANPFIEALAVFWKYYFPDEFVEVQQAHDRGELFFSMECVSDTITEVFPDGTVGETFAYRGPSDPSYSEAINKRECARRFDNPHFLGGALIIPPTQPGWKQAEVKEISKLLNFDMESAIDEAEKDDDLSVEVWSRMMDLVLHHAAREV